MSRKEEFFFDSAAIGERIRAVRHIPEGEVRATLVIAHGMAEHIDRYDEFAVYLAERGILVSGEDHLGHGRTARREEDLGYFASGRGDDALTADLCELARITRECAPDAPHLVLGHSMGSFFVRRLLTVIPDAFDGAIVMGTGHQNRLLVSAGLAISRAIALFRGDRHRSRLVDRLAFGGYNRAFEPSRTPHDWLSRDTDRVDAYEADSRCGFLFTLGGYIGMFRTITMLYSKRRLSRIPRELPVLFISGGDDPVGELGAGVRRAHRSLESVGMTELSLRLYEGARHEILNETNREEVFADLLAWIEEIIDRSRADA